MKAWVAFITFQNHINNTHIQKDDGSDNTRGPSNVELKEDL